MIPIPQCEICDVFHLVALPTLTHIMFVATVATNKAFHVGGLELVGRIPYSTFAAPMRCALFLVLFRAGFADGILLTESQLLFRKFLLESHSVAGPMAQPFRRMLLFDRFPIDVFASKLPQQQCGTF